MSYAKNIMSLIEKMNCANGESYFALRDGVRAGIESLEEELATAQTDAHDRIAALEAQISEQSENIVALKAERAAAQAEALALRKDAGRYRWLREHSYKDGDSYPMIKYGPGYHQTKPEILDAAIDAARKGEA